MNGIVDGPGTGFMDNCMGQMMGGPMMSMMLSGGLVLLLLIAVLGLSLVALIKYLQRLA